MESDVIDSHVTVIRLIKKVTYVKKWLIVLIVLIPLNPDVQVM